VLKRSALLAGFSIVLVATAPVASALSLLSPPGNGIPIVSKNKPIKPLNTEMITALADNQFFVRGQHGLMIKKNPREKTYDSSYALPDKSFDILCSLSVEQGSIHITAGNIKFVVLPGRTEIYQDGKVIKTYENKGIRGVEFERGYDFENKIGSIARIHVDGYAPGVEVRILFPAKISVTVMPNTVGIIEKWEWVRGTT